jgi:hypothetical protein
MGPNNDLHRKARCSVHVPLPKHAGYSLVRHPTDRSQTINGISAVKVFHR